MAAHNRLATPSPEQLRVCESNAALGLPSTVKFVVLMMCGLDWRCAFCQRKNTSDSTVCVGCHQADTGLVHMPSVSVSSTVSEGKGGVVLVFQNFAFFAREVGNLLMAEHAW